MLVENVKADMYFYDDFNDDIENTTKWTDDPADGFVEAGQRLQPVTSSSDWRYYYSRANFSRTQTFVFNVDVTINVFTYYLAIGLITNDTKDGAESTVATYDYAVYFDYGNNLRIYCSGTEFSYNNFIETGYKLRFVINESVGGWILIQNTTNPDVNTWAKVKHCTTGSDESYVVQFSQYEAVSNYIGIDNVNVTNLTRPISTIPTITFHNPQNNTKIHNKTIIFNFSIDDPNEDKINYTLWVDTNSNPITSINGTNNTLDLNWTFNYTFNTETNGSINGTYYWKINGTDNNSNEFESSIYTFNITNDINLYNVTNVTITTLPLSAGDVVTCHFNLTNKEGQNDTISIKDQRWWVNVTLITTAGNQTLGAGNTSIDSNVTCEARINNGYGQTAWTKYVNSSQTRVGDSTPPTITNISIQNTTSYTTDDKVNITAIVEDAVGTIKTNSVKVTVNDSTGLMINYTMSLLVGDTYYVSRAFAVGTYNIPYVYAQDGSDNQGYANSSNSFTVTSPPSGDGTTPTGGGGPSVIEEKIVVNKTIIEQLCNFNGICEGERGEDFLNCGNEKAGIWNIGGDCAPEFGAIFCDSQTGQCIWRFGLAFRILSFLGGLSFVLLIILAILPKKEFEKVKAKTKSVIKSVRF